MHHLKNYIADIENSLKHLNSVMGHQINLIDKNLDKVNGVKLAKRSQRSTKLESLASSLSSKIFNSGLNGLGNMVKKEIVPGDASSAYSSRMSQGQILAEAASAISRAMARNL